MQVKPINLKKLRSAYKTLKANVTPYGYGAKAEGGSDPRTGHHWNPRSTGRLSTPLSTIDNIDCSGAIRKFGWESTDGILVLPDGSQNQLAWCEARAKEKDSGVRKVNYRDAAHYMTGTRLFIAFIKPWTNGCEGVGHVWFLLFVDGEVVAMTIESHGGKGVNSRRWDTPVLLNQVYACFELPAV